MYIHIKYGKSNFDMFDVVFYFHIQTKVKEVGGKRRIKPPPTRPSSDDIINLIYRIKNNPPQAPSIFKSKLPSSFFSKSNQPFIATIVIFFATVGTIRSAQANTSNELSIPSGI